MHRIRHGKRAVHGSCILPCVQRGTPLTRQACDRGQMRTATNAGGTAMQERRNYQRLDLKGYAYDCSVQINGEEYYARLLDISQGGARLQLQGDYDPDMRYGSYGKVKEEYYKPAFLHDHYYSVVWSYGKEVGVSFSGPLLHSYEDMKNYYQQGDYKQQGYYPQDY
jgi:hypothetical protein